MEKRHSVLGIAAFIISLAASLLILTTFVIAGVLELRSPGGMDAKAVSTVIVGLAIIGLMLCDLLALCLGIGALFQQDTKKIFAVLGIILSSLTLLGTVGLIILGLLTK